MADELNCETGGIVGYAIRFEDMTGPKTLIKYATDGLLLMECLRDPEFSAYDCVILDEAHERTLHTDILLGLLKKVLKKRPDLKIIITSATLNIRKFANYFGNCPVITIPGKLHPVDIKYLPVPTRGALENAHDKAEFLPLWLRAKKPDVYLQMVVSKVLSIHFDKQNKDKGGILVFLPGKEEIDLACIMMSNNQSEDMDILPIYAALPFDAQCGIFEPSKPGQRKIVVATNIAETSITLDGIHFVVDSGLFKESIYDHGIESLRVTVISKAQAEQRAGRAGRTAPGVCWRMYSLPDYERMLPAQSPAIRRINLTSMVLQLKAMGIDDICNFGFIDAPRAEQVGFAMTKLIELGALDNNNAVTEMGYKMAEFPLSPNLAKILLMASFMECSDDVLTIVSMLSVKVLL